MQLPIGRQRGGRIGTGRRLVEGDALDRQGVGESGDPADRAGHRQFEATSSAPISTSSSGASSAIR